jgi:hypothetical protein
MIFLSTPSLSLASSSSQPLPQQLDHVPAGAAEFAFQFLDDLAVAAHRAVQALQVAVDHEDQVVQLLARGQPMAPSDSTRPFRRRRRTPRPCGFRCWQCRGVQVLQEARLVDGHQRAQAHGHRGELPEVGHQLGVRVARQALAVHFLAEVQQLLFGDAAFQVGAGIDAGRDVALDVQAVAAVVFALGVPEVVEAGRKHVGQRSEGADVAAQVTAFGGAGGWP